MHIVYKDSVNHETFQFRIKSKFKPNQLCGGGLRILTITPHCHRKILCKGPLHTVIYNS